MDELDKVVLLKEKDERYVTAMANVFGVRGENDRTNDVVTKDNLLNNADDGTKDEAENPLNEDEVPNVMFLPTLCISDVPISSSFHMRPVERNSDSCCERKDLVSLSSMTNTTAIVFTSANAVRSVLLQYDSHVRDQVLHGQHLSSFRVYCVGKKTTAEVETNFKCKVIGMEKKAADLARRIIADRDTDDECPVSNIIFFCGNPHRPELPSLLKNAKIECEEVVCYKSVVDEKAVARVMQFVVNPKTAIVFFSPSTASHFVQNLSEAVLNDMSNIKVSSKLIAIGPTTAAEFKSLSDVHIHVSEKPTPECVAKAIMEANTNNR
eukprot:m.86492 g.86492  ORF g.86492 m.86492 type:complete len:323 (+) comp12216_c0_seq2:40-1008(+)